MATLAQIQAGTRVRKNVTLKIGDADVVVAIRVLNVAESSAVMEAARVHAIGKGLTDPGDGDPIFDLAVWTHTALLACSDPDSPADAPAPFFTSADEIAKSPVLTPDHLAFLYEMQEQVQAEHSPYDYKLTTEGMGKAITLIAAGDRDPFVRMSPGARFNFTRITALRYLASREARSSSTPSSPESSDPTEALDS